MRTTEHGIRLVLGSWNELRAFRFQRKGVPARAWSKTERRASTSTHQPTWAWSFFALNLGALCPFQLWRRQRPSSRTRKKAPSSPENIEERAKHVEEELAMIEEAVENGGSVPGDGDGEPIGVRGIVGGQTCNLAARRDSRLARHNAPKKACPSC